MKVTDWEIHFHPQAKRGKKWRAVCMFGIWTKRQFTKEHWDVEDFGPHPLIAMWRAWRYARRYEAALREQPGPWADNLKRAG